MITAEEVLQDLEEIVASKPEGYKYTLLDEEGARIDDPTCVYFNPCDGSPACLVGHYLAKKGLTAELFQQPSNFGSGPINTDVFISLPAEVYDYIDLSPEAVGLLQKVQELQDEECTWREALEKGYEHDA